MADFDISEVILNERNGLSTLQKATFKNKDLRHNDFILDFVRFQAFAGFWAVRCSDLPVHLPKITQNACEIEPRMRILIACYTYVCNNMFTYKSIIECITDENYAKPEVLFVEMF